MFGGKAHLRWGDMDTAQVWRSEARYWNYVNEGGNEETIKTFRHPLGRNSIRKEIIKVNGKPRGTMFVSSTNGDNISNVNNASANKCSLLSMFTKDVQCCRFQGPPCLWFILSCGFRVCVQFLCSITFDVPDGLLLCKSTDNAKYGKRRDKINCSQF